jgi:alkanesulfonate monooxygenase SsuD/methylene tetrahydromethanopterin reductase-like flavin-dependent oxidoreductase (luciferase family)
MKFGVMQLVSSPEHAARSDERMYQEVLEQIQYAEELGFDSVWLGEHHFTDYGNIPSVLVFAAAAAQRTERIRIGTAVLLLPFSHPVRLAAEVAMVDLLSRGRLDLGIGRGYQPKEFAGFGIPMEESRDRFDETLEIMRLLWAQESVTYHGRFYQLDDVSLRLKPVQKPHPPLWLAAVSPETYSKAGRLGLRFLSAPNWTPLDRIKVSFESYRSALQEAGWKGSHWEYPIMQQTYVGETETLAAEEPREECIWFYRYWSYLVSVAPGESLPDAYKNYQRIGENARNIPYNQLLDRGENFVAPRQVVERIELLREELGLTYYIGWFNFGGLPHQKVMQSMRLFAEEVMPAFRTESQAA